MTSTSTRRSLTPWVVSAFFGIFLSSTVAQGFIDARVSAGTSDGKYKWVEDGSGAPVSDTVAEPFSNKGTQISGGVGISPIPLVPFSIGLFYSMTNAKGKYREIWSTKVDSGRGGLDVTVWAPIPGIKPYIRGGYYLFGKENLSFIIEDSSVKYPLDVKGYQIGLGVGFSIVPLVSVFLDYSLDRYSLTAKKAVVTVAGVSETVSGDESVKFSNAATTLSLGLAISI